MIQKNDDSASALSQKQKLAIIRAARRKLDFRVGTKPIGDAQILGPAYDLHVEGTYLGWTSKRGCEEARALYRSTPSQLREDAGIASLIGRSYFATEVGMTLRECRHIEDELRVLEPSAARRVGIIRERLESLHERVCIAEELAKTSPPKLPEAQS